MIKKYFLFSILFTLICYLLAIFYGYKTTGTLLGVLSILQIITVLSLLEVSLSFDNAVVNAKILATMDKKWRRRFLTWGIAFSVFFVRIFCPLIIIGLATFLPLKEILYLAFNEPDKYASLLEESRYAINGFGGSFLLMVALSFFISPYKEHHWIKFIEKPLHNIKHKYIARYVVTLSIIAIFSSLINSEHLKVFLISSTIGILSFELIYTMNRKLSSMHIDIKNAKTGLMGFMYLNILDSSFSIDGVVGALAFSHDIVIISLGLAIGAIFVRSFTIVIVDYKMISRYNYIENGAFASIFFLSLIMFWGNVGHFPEWMIAFISIGFLALAARSSIRENNKGSRLKRGL